MPKIAFFAAAASAPLGGLTVLMAWDRHDIGPAGVDQLELNGIGLYTWVVPLVGAQLARVKTESPIEIPELNCPEFLDGFPDREFVVRFEVKPGGTGLASFADLSLDVFDDSRLVYGAAAAGATLKFELSRNSILPAPISVQDRPTLQALEDPLQGVAQLINFRLPALELWRSLMTPHQPLELF